MARYAYYRRLSRSRQKTYRQSDEIERIALPKNHGLEELAGELAGALFAEDRELVTRLCGKLAGGVCTSLFKQLVPAV